LADDEPLAVAAALAVAAPEAALPEAPPTAPVAVAVLAVGDPEEWHPESRAAATADAAASTSPPLTDLLLRPAADGRPHPD
jgi:hypothetical protein